MPFGFNQFLCLHRQYGEHIPVDISAKTLVGGEYMRAYSLQRLNRKIVGHTIAIITYKWELRIGCTEFQAPPFPAKTFDFNHLKLARAVGFSADGISTIAICYYNTAPARTREDGPMTGSPGMDQPSTERFG